MGLSSRARPFDLTIADLANRPLLQCHQAVGRFVRRRASDSTDDGQVGRGQASLRAQEEQGPYSGRGRVHNLPG